MEACGQALLQPVFSHYFAHISLFRENLSEFFTLTVFSLDKISYCPARGNIYTGSWNILKITVKIET